MGILLPGLIGAVVAFVILFKAGKSLLLRHVIAFVVAAAVTALLVSLSFQMAYPMHSSGWRSMYNVYVGWGIVAAVLGPLLGSLAAFAWRRRSTLT